MSKFDGQNSGFWCVTPLSCSVFCRHRSTETGNVVNYHLTGGGQKTFDLKIYASYVFRSGKHLSRLLSYLRESYDAMIKALPKFKKKLRGASPSESLPPAYQKLLALHRRGDNWPRSQSRSSDDDSKLSNLAASRIKIHYFGRQISTFCHANTPKTDCAGH